MSDHIPGIPAFTLEERRRILMDLIKLSHEKPGRILYMLRDGTAYTDLIVNLFDEQILCLIEAYTFGHLCQRVHCSTDKTCIRQIRSVIQNTLLTEYVEPTESMLRYLWEMLED